MLATVVNEWPEVTPNQQPYSKVDAIKTVQSLEDRFRDGNTGNAYSVWHAGEKALSLEIYGSRVSIEPELGVGVAPVAMNTPFEDALILSNLVRVPFIQYESPAVTLTEAVETNQFVLAAELPYASIKGMALHVAPDKTGRSAVIVDVEEGGWLLLLAETPEDAHKLHVALSALR